jgi:hypothetical protein
MKRKYSPEKDNHGYYWDMQNTYALPKTIWDLLPFEYEIDPPLCSECNGELPGTYYRKYFKSKKDAMKALDIAIKRIKEEIEEYSK